MSAAKNKQVVQSAFGELERGNSQPFLDMLSDTVKWRVMGTTSWSGTFDGKDTVLTKLLGPLRRQVGGRVKVIPGRFVAEADLVVVEGRGHDNVTVTGKSYNNGYCWIYRFADGKVVELTEYLDTQLVATALEDPS